MSQTLHEAPDSNVYGSISHSSWDTLHQLPVADKMALWSEFRDRPIVTWLLGEHFAGTQIDWLEQMLDSGEMAPDDALSAYSAYGPSPSIADWSKLLVPRGVAAEKVAGLRFLGGWSGDRSVHFAAIVNEFQAMTMDSDSSVRAVGEAGVQMFSEASLEAATQERERRIRGQL